MYLTVIGKHIEATNFEIDTKELDFDFMQDEYSTAPMIEVFLPRLNEFEVQFDLIFDMFFTQMKYHIRVALQEIKFALLVTLSSDSEG